MTNQPRQPQGRPDGGQFKRIGNSGSGGLPPTAGSDRDDDNRRTIREMTDNPLGCANHLTPLAAGGSLTEGQRNGLLTILHDTDNDSLPQSRLALRMLAADDLQKTGVDYGGWDTRIRRADHMASRLHMADDSQYQPYYGQLDDAIKHPPSPAYIQASDEFDHNPLEYADRNMRRAMDGKLTQAQRQALSERVGNAPYSPQGRLASRLLAADDLRKPSHDSERAAEVNHRWHLIVEEQDGKATGDDSEYREYYRQLDKAIRLGGSLKHEK